MTLCLWLATYLIHSTCAVLVAIVAGRWIRDEQTMESLWRAAVLIPVFSATAAQFSPAWSWSIDVANVTAAVPSTGAGWSSWFTAAAVTSLLVGAAAFVRDWVARGRFLRSLDRSRTDGALRQELERLSDLAGVKRPIHLTSSGTLTSPIVASRDEICVPTRAVAELDLDEQRALLAHELAHIIRRDESWQSLIAAVQRVLWMQPLNRLAARELRAIAESACDRWAADVMANPIAMASCLVEVSNWVSGPQPVAILGMVGSRGVGDRVRRLLAHKTRAERAWSQPARVLIVLAGLVVLWCVPAVAMAPSHSPDYWAGFELGRRYHAEHPDAPQTKPDPAKARQLAEIEAQRRLKR